MGNLKFQTLSNDNFMEVIKSIKITNKLQINIVEKLYIKVCIYKKSNYKLFSDGKIEEFDDFLIVNNSSWIIEKDKKLLKLYITNDFKGSINSKCIYLPEEKMKKLINIVNSTYNKKIDLLNLSKKLNIPLNIVIAFKGNITNIQRYLNSLYNCNIPFEDIDNIFFFLSESNTITLNLNSPIMPNRKSLERIFFILQIDSSNVELKRICIYTYELLKHRIMEKEISRKII